MNASYLKISCEKIVFGLRFWCVTLACFKIPGWIGWRNIYTQRKQQQQQQQKKKKDKKEIPPLREWGSLTIAFLGKFAKQIYGSPFYPVTAQSQCLMAIGKDSGSSTLCHSCEFTCQ